MMLISIPALGQQLPQFSQYFQNPYLINPAASSLYHDIDINIGVRQQWSGFDDAPITYYAGGTVRLGSAERKRRIYFSSRISRYGQQRLQNMRKLVVDKPKHVVGGLVSIDKFGFFSRNSIMGSYAYHYPISNKYYLVGAASMGWYGFNFNSNDVIAVDAIDNTYSDFVRNGSQSNLFDINAGVLLYSEDLTVGYSVYQIAQNQIYLDKGGERPNFSNARLRIHHYFTGSYKFRLSNNFDLTPSTLLKFLNNAPFSFDLNLRAEYRKSVWAGVSYRNEDGVALMAGGIWDGWLKFGYAHDINTSRVSDISSGSNEIVLGILLNR
jgi:type IX secretion system PorP/SprF family membrane protein